MAPSAHKFLDYDDYAFTCESLHRDFSFKLKIDDHDEADEELEEQEFSFACVGVEGSLVAADEIFQNGKIRPLFPITTEKSELHQPSLKKLFVEHSNSQGETKGKFQDFGIKRKSNSTGFSKILRLRDEDMKLRSRSDRKDAFVFMNEAVACGEAKVRNSSGKRKMAPYMMNKNKNQSDKRRSFLPYKHQLFGFFANMNGFTKNLHPF